MPFFHKFCDLNKTTKLKDANNDTIPTFIGIVCCIAIVWFEFTKVKVAQIVLNVTNFHGSRIKGFYSNSRFHSHDIFVKLGIFCVKSLNFIKFSLVSFMKVFFYTFINMFLYRLCCSLFSMPINWRSVTFLLHIFNKFVVTDSWWVTTNMQRNRTRKPVILLNDCVGPVNFSNSVSEVSVK